MHAVHDVLTIGDAVWASDGSGQHRPVRLLLKAGANLAEVRQVRGANSRYGQIIKRKSMNGREMMPGQIAVQTDAAEFEPLASFDSVFKTYGRLVLQL